MTTKKSSIESGESRTEQIETPSERLRPVRLLLDRDVVHRMDEIIHRGLGGYRDRHEFARDALEAYALELLYPDGERSRPPASAADVTELPKRRSDMRVVATDVHPVTTDIDVPPPLELDDVSQSALRPVARGVAIDSTLTFIRREPLLGLHNRDWPSLWALTEIAKVCAAEPRPAREVYDAVTAAAWPLGRALRALEKSSGQRALSALLPSNVEKQQSAVAGFQAFAIGQLSRRPRAEDGLLTASGPLYQWGALSVTGNSSRPLLGVTAVGWDLLDLTVGLTAGNPHEDRVAQRFLECLREHAPEDAWGFALLLRAVAEGAGRADLAERFVAARPWSESVATSASQGYLARSREWGFVEPKLIDGRYALTEAGERKLHQLETTHGRGRAKTSTGRRPRR